ncbi:MAG: M13 family metallopeptidase, partial [Proteobacteria bacterium]|nr:M13 family metallopeptidase [Pseudomonadota bacterium]
MKKVLILIAAALAVSSCTNNEAENSVVNEVTSPVTEVTNEVVNEVKLTSGIDLQYVDESVRPQDDFYRHVNGKWLKEYVMPADKSSYGSFNALREKSEKDVKAIIDELAKNTYEKDTDEQKISDLYNSYMDTESIEKAGINVLDNDLSKINDIESYDDLMAYMSYADMNTDAPMGLYVYIDLKDSNKHITYISQSGLSLPEKDYYLNQGDKFKDIRGKYLTLIENMYTHAGFDQPLESAKTIMAIETKIAQAHWTNVQTRDAEKSYKLKSYAEFKALMPKLNIGAWMAGTTLKDVTEVVVRQPDYLERLNDIIAETSIEDWKT